MFDVEKTLESLSLDEKLKMLSGKDFWHTVDYPEKGVGSVEVADGPYGIRKQKGLCDHLGWNVSEKATAYVSGPGIASSFDTELAHELGKHLAAEARSQEVDVLLGPAVNIVRTPLCGRNFEYYSEDPYLAGSIASEYIKGVQSQGVGTCIKHFAANNQEIDREYIDARMSERTLRETYLAVFEKAVKEAKPWSVMSALNKVNGEYCSENKHLITDILRNEWGFDGLVMSDWSGVNSRVRALQAGLDLEMPYSYGIGEDRVRKALEEGFLDEKSVDDAVRNLLKLYAKVCEGRKKQPDYLYSDHNIFAREMAEKCAVLLKNDNNLLPISKKSKIAVIGRFAKEPRFKMEGSALVNPSRFDVPYDEICSLSEGMVSYAEGYDENSGLSDESLQEALRCAVGADVAVIFAGLPGGIEAEGKDRKNLMMPESHVKLIKEVARKQPNVVVILSNGSPVDLSWDSATKAILEVFLAGQCMGSAVARLLFGLSTPGGKLPVSFPYHLEQTPAYINYPGHSGIVNYAEEVFVGYKYYSTKRIPVRYPFGFGLSYTQFNIESQSVVSNGNSITLSLSVENIGEKEGSEVIQLYIRAPKSRIPMPDRNLKAFKRVYLTPGEKRNIEFILEENDFAYFDEDLSAWYAAEGSYDIMIATSSESILFTRSVYIKPERVKHEEITGWSTIGSVKQTPNGMRAIERIRQALLNSNNDTALNFPLLQKNGETDEQVDKIPLRMITVLTDNVINNDIMDCIISDLNKENLRCYR